MPTTPSQEKKRTGVQARPRIADVAARANVSPMTVSRALSTPALVSDQTRTLVMEAAAALGYVPNRLARGLRSGRTSTIAVVTADLQQRLNSIKLELLHREIARQGYQMLLLVQGEPAADNMPSPLHASQGSVDGVLLCCLERGPSVAEIRRLMDAGVPVVSLEHYSDPAIDTVTADRESGMRLVVEHLIRLGHRRIGLAQLAMESEVVARRAAGYRQAMADAGLTPLLLVRQSASASLFEDGYRLIVDAGPEGERLSAWIFPDDEMAVGAIRALQDAGKRVPDRVAVIGCDNSPLCDFVQPRLSSLTQPTEETVRRALERLLAHLRGERPRPGIQLVRPRLVVRDSCGGAPREDASRDDGEKR